MAAINYEPLRYHAGVIQAAINLEFCGPEDDFGGVGLYTGKLEVAAIVTFLHIWTVNLNGQLPNFDMVVVATFSAQYEGIPIYLHGLSPEYHENPLIERYLNKGKALLSFLRHQAFGVPDKDHAFYQKYEFLGWFIVRGIYHLALMDRYKIEALTIKGHKHANQDSLPAHRFGR
jgi:hypothetical protein